MFRFVTYKSKEEQIFILFGKYASDLNNDYLPFKTFEIQPKE